jgi:signal transduction histidine kinase
VARWWNTARAAGRWRLAYEGSLALGVAAVTTVASLASGNTAPTLAAGFALSTLVLVPLRLRYPAGALVAAAAIGAIANTQTTLLLFVLSVSAGYRMSSFPRAALAFAGVLLSQLGRWWWADLWYWPFALLGTSSFLMVDLLPAVVAQMVSQRRQLLAGMHERNAYLRDQQAVVAERARARERDRIARELHDSLGNRLTLITLYAGALGTAPAGQREETVDLLRATSATAMAELRQILGILHQSDRSEDADANLSLDGLDQLVDAARSTGTRVTLRSEGTSGQLPSIVEHAAYRTAQEGVTNALRHARGAAVRITMRYEPDAVVVEVVNGPGAPHDTPTTGQGLIGLAERVRLAGGVLYHGWEPDAGFRLAATLPLAVRPPEPHPAEPAGARTPARAPTPDPTPTPATDDVSHHLHRSAQRSRAWLLALSAGIVALVCGLCAGTVGLVVHHQTVSPATFDALRVGQDEDLVRTQLPERSAAVSAATGGSSPPTGASCVDYYAATPDLLRLGHRVYRFCFRDGTLLTKEAFTDGGS